MTQCRCHDPESPEYATACECGPDCVCRALEGVGDTGADFLDFAARAQCPSLADE